MTVISELLSISHDEYINDKHRQIYMCVCDIRTSQSNSYVRSVSLLTKGRNCSSKSYN